jgi:hypothetical protein
MTSATRGCRFIGFFSGFLGVTDGVAQFATTSHTAGRHIQQSAPLETPNTHQKKEEPGNHV